MASDGFPHPVDLPGNFSVADKPKRGEHWSDCAVHSEPAFPAGRCNCGAQDDAEVNRILAMSDEGVIASFEAGGRDPEALAEAMRGQMGATFRLCEEIKHWKEEARSWRAVAERLETEKQAAGGPVARDQIAKVLDPEAFAHGDRSYYGPDLDKATYSARLRVSLKRAAEIAALPTPSPVEGETP